MSQIESVESRCLFSFTLVDALNSDALPITAKLSKTGVLSITGTAGRDTVNVTQDGNFIRVTGEGGVTYLASYGMTGDGFDVGMVKRINVYTDGGRDYVKVKLGQNNRKPISAQINGGGANDTLVAEMKGATLLGGAGNDYLVSDAGSGLTRFALATNFAPTRGVEFVSGQFATRPLGDTTVITTIGDSRNVLDGGSGDDRLSTRGGDDSVYGGSGTDSVTKLNDLNVYFNDLPSRVNQPLPVTINFVTTSTTSRLAVFGVESILAAQSTSPNYFIADRSIVVGTER